MSQRDLRFAIVTSTSGSVMNEVLKNDFFRRKVHSVIVDRECDALKKARDHGVRTKAFYEDGIDPFCDRLREYLINNGIDYVFSYYTNFYTKPIRDTVPDRIINFHPSLLPAFKGIDGFGDTLAYHARFAGNTVEFVADVMDEGKIIMQTACPIDTNIPVRIIRHRIFVQQCKALLQVAKWLNDGRISVEGRCVTVAGGKYHDFEFSPALDFDDAALLDLPAHDLVSAG